MTTDEINFKNIQKILSSFVTEIKIDSKINLHDINIFGENIIKKIFCIVYDYNLINANSLSFNEVGFDLIDKEKGVLVQVTSTNSAEKISTSIDSCIKNHKNFEYYFVGLFSENIAKETKKYKFYSKKGIKVIKENILNIPSLCRIIHYQDSNKIKRISDYLDTQFDYYQNLKKSTSVRIRNEYIPFLEKLFNIFSINFWNMYTDYSQVNVIPRIYVERIEEITRILFVQDFIYKKIRINFWLNKLLKQLKEYQNQFSKKMIIFDNDSLYREDKSWKITYSRTAQYSIYEKESEEWNNRMYNTICNITVIMNKLLSVSKKTFYLNNFPTEKYVVWDQAGVRNQLIPAIFIPSYIISYTANNKLSLLSKIKIYFAKLKFKKEYS